MVNPLYRKDDEFCEINYRPVAVLRALDNIFGKASIGADVRMLRWTLIRLHKRL